MDILGVNTAKFKSGATTVQLERSEIDPTFIDPDVIEHKSILNGHVEFKARKYAEFILIHHLCNYVDPAIKYNEVASYLFTAVEFYPHSEGAPIKNKFGGTVPFFIVQVKPFYLEDDDNYDALIIKFKSTSPITYNQIVAQGYGYNYAKNYGIGL
jgi:hypothetical protein